MRPRALVCVWWGLGHASTHRCYPIVVWLCTVSGATYSSANSGRRIEYSTSDIFPLVCRCDVMFDRRRRRRCERPRQKTPRRQARRLDAFNGQPGTGIRPYDKSTTSRRPYRHDCSKRCGGSIIHELWPRLQNACTNHVFLFVYAFYTLAIAFGI